MTNLEDYTEKIMHTFSIGTRFKGVKVEKEYWKVKLPNGKTGYLEDQDLYEIKPIVKESLEQLRESIIATSKKFLNFPYSWGGRTTYSELFGNISSVDCSGMINVCFLAHGLQIPRMSKDQFLHALEIKDGTTLQPGDLIFFASVLKNPNINPYKIFNKHPLYIDHVMMYIGNDELIESAGSNLNVRIINCKKRFGKPCSQITSGDIITSNNHDFYIYFATFFTSEMIQSLRDDALKNIYPELETYGSR